MRIFGPKRHKLIWICRKLHNEEHCNLCLLSDVAHLIEMNRVIGHTAHMGWDEKYKEFWLVNLMKTHFGVLNRR